MFRRDCSRTARSEQSVGELFAAVGLREPPCGSIDQGETLYRGELCLTFAQDCYGGQALPVGEPGNPEGIAWLAAGCHQARQRPTPASATAPARPDAVEPDGGRSVTPTTTPAAPGLSTEHARAPTAAPHSATPHRLTRGSNCVGSGIGSPSLPTGLVIKAVSRCSQHQPSAAYQGAGAPPDLTYSSGAKPGPAPGPLRTHITSPRDLRVVLEPDTAASAFEVRPGHRLRRSAWGCRVLLRLALSRCRVLAPLKRTGAYGHRAGTSMFRAVNAAFQPLTCRHPW